MLGLSRGLGQTLTTLTSSNVSFVSESLFASSIIYILSATLAKMSTLYLMMRLFNLAGRKAQTKHHGKHRLYLYTCFAILLVMLVWGVASCVAIGVKCNASTLVLPPNESQCTSQGLRWQIITGLDVATEVLLVVNAMFIVAPVQLALHLKVKVVCAFLFRLPLVALAVLRLHYVQSATTDANPGTAQSEIMVLQQAYLCWSIISATLPNLKAFVRSFGSGFGIGVDMETYTNAYGSKQSARKDYEMGQMSGNVSANRSHTPTSKIEDDAIIEDTVKPIRSVNSYQGGMVQGHTLPRSAHGEKDQQYSNDREVDSIESTGSDAHIIRREVGWTIHYEDNDGAPRAI